MRVIVGVKRVIDYSVKVRVLADKTAVDLNNVKMGMNPFCEIALEESIRLKEKKIASEVVAVSIGPKECDNILRTAMAMGADRAIHIQTNQRPDMDLQPLAVAKALVHIVKKEKADLVVVGKQSIDTDNGMVGQMLAALLQWPQGTFVSKLQFPNDNKKEVLVERETDSGTEQLNLLLPAVLTADLRLNEPRYATLPNIMKAKKKVVEVIAADSLKDIDFAPRHKILKVEEPAARKAGIFVNSVDELIEKLRNEAKVI